MKMNLRNQRRVLWARLPVLLIRPGKNTGPSRSREVLSTRQITQWLEFEREVQAETTATLGAPHGPVNEPKEGSFMTATENGVYFRL